MHDGHAQRESECATISSPCVAALSSEPLAYPSISWDREISARWSHLECTCMDGMTWHGMVRLLPRMHCEIYMSLHSTIRRRHHLDPHLHPFFQINHFHYHTVRTIRHPIPMIPCSMPPIPALIMMIDSYIHKVTRSFKFPHKVSACSCSWRALF